MRNDRVRVRKTAGRPLIYGLVIGGLLLAAAGKSRAQIPVTDAANLSQAISQGFTMINQLEQTRAQLRRLQDNIKKLKDPHFRDVGRQQGRLDAVIRSAEGLSYATGRLRETLRKTFPGAALPKDETAARRARLTKMLSTTFGTLRSLQVHAAQMEGSSQDMQRFEQQMRTLQTPQQIAELQGTLQTYQAQETILLRRALITQINQQAVMNAYEINRQQQAEAWFEQMVQQHQEYRQDQRSQGFTVDDLVPSN